MSTTVDNEITVVIPSSKIADPEFIQQEVTKAKLRVLIEVHKGSDKTLYGLIKEFLPDVVENKALLREFNISTDSKTEFKLKLSTSEKKIEADSSGGSENKLSCVSTKPKVTVKKSSKVKAKIKIFKKKAESTATTVVENKVQLPAPPIVENDVETAKEEVNLSTAEDNSKSDSSTTLISNDVPSSIVTAPICEINKSKPKKKVLKLSKKKTIKD